MLGWIGSIAFAVCGAPLVYSCIRQKSAKSVNPVFLILWTVGEVCYIIQVCTDYGFVIWMMFNYLLNSVFIVIILYYKVRYSELSNKHG
jgi:uncharacterized protein with PQ loop repeat